MTHSGPRRGWIVLAALVLLAGAASCGKPPVDREAYADLWVRATLRALEKGTEPREELDRILACEGIRPEAFRDAQVEWFGEDTQEQVRQALRRRLEPSRFLPRMEYVRCRVIAELRSQIRGTAFSDEFQALGERRRHTLEAYEAARTLWEGDADTEREIGQARERLSGAVRVPFEAYRKITGSEEYNAPPESGLLAEELRRRGIAAEDWKAMEEVFRVIPRADLVRCRAVAEYRARARGRPFADELAILGGERGFSPEAYETAREFRETEPETAGDLERKRLELREALPGAEYAECRVIADLRAKSRGSAVPREFEEELAALGTERGFAPGAFHAAREVWEGDPDTDREIGRKFEEHARARAVAELRSRIRKRALSEEISALAAKQGFAAGAYRAALELWEGDAEAGQALESARAELSGALNVPWEAWKAVTEDPAYAGPGRQEHLARELRARGLSPGDWKAMEALFGE
jgi:hypothetical protein